MGNANYIPACEIRARFAAAMSAMYRDEVPQYGELVELVKQVNLQFQQQHTDATDPDSLQRLSEERHGAIRLGTPAELFNMRRLFAVMGMLPVSYYDLSAAGIPVHSTAFRPIALKELNCNPFRVFTSLLRLDLIQDERLREQAQELLDKRSIFTPQAMELIHLHETQQGLSATQAEQFVIEALETFRWHKQATVNLETYEAFVNTHRLIADIVCFKGPHINHLTPRTLDIDEAQKNMTQRGMQPKTIVEGPPRRKHPVLLRQTSFKALDEKIDFIESNNRSTQGSHTARFGEIEQRGMALTPKGRKLYDRLLDEVRLLVPDSVQNPRAYEQQLTKTFSVFPDDITTLHTQALAYLRYQPGKHEYAGEQASLAQLISSGIIDILPITYEDFLPISAAGIFQSNLDGRETQAFTRSPNQQALEQALGCEVHDEFFVYHRIQKESLNNCLNELKIGHHKKHEILTEFEHRYR